MKKYTYIDLFAGAGGLSLGFGNAGMELEFANDIAKEALDTFRHNLTKTHPELNPERIIHGDITALYEHLGTSKVKNNTLGHKVIETDREVSLRMKAPDVKNDDIKRILSEIKSVDILAGGPPCQGFSMIGRSKKANIEERMKGFVDDPRNQLFQYFLKFAEKLNPKIVLIENVKGLGSAAGYRDLIVESLRKTGSGYDVSSEVLNAKEFGLAQHRERLFFIGVRKDLLENNEDLNSKFIFSEIIKAKEEPLKLWDVIEDLPQIKANPKPSNYSVEAEVSFSDAKTFGMDVSDNKYDKLTEGSSYTEKINTYNEKYIVPEFLYNHKSRYHNERDLFIYKHLAAGKYLNDTANKKALSKVTYGVTTDDKGNKVVKGFGDKYFKLNPESVSKTIIAHLETDGNSYVHPGKNPRSITPREAARIQSFPDWYRFMGGTRNQLKQVGNAVPPMLAFKIAEVIKETLNNFENNSDKK